MRTRAQGTVCQLQQAPGNFPEPPDDPKVCADYVIDASIFEFASKAFLDGLLDVSANQEKR